MKWYIVFTLVSLLGCSQPSVKQCVINGGLIVAITHQNTNALDGYEYQICPLTNGVCSKYSRLSAIRPTSIEVRISDNNVYVTQNGGSVESYTSDPIGMFDPSYENQPHMYLQFTESVYNGTEIKAFVNGRPAPLRTCP